jgi:uncharacterized membrane protein YjjP (DUF1212 family)
VGYPNISWILEQEPNHEFQSVHQRWRPQNLLFIHQVSLLLKDIQARYVNLELARRELQTLEKAPKYIKYLQRMRLWVRQAGFAWQADHLKFLKSVAGFYADYGAVLRMLRIDQVRGKFSEPATSASRIGV